MSIKHFKDLDIYSRSYELALRIHIEVCKLAKDKRDFDLADQLSRSSKSVPANIAEGFGKNTSKLEFAKFLRTALGSANETLVHLDFTKDLNIISEELHSELYEECEQICKMIQSLISKLNNI